VEATEDRPEGVMRPDGVSDPPDGRGGSSSESESDSSSESIVSFVVLI
jgi:hypothetical protein